MQRDPAREQAIIWRLVRAINTILKGDQIRMTEEAGEEFERMLELDPPLQQEALHRMKGWYRAAVNRAPPPARVNLERIMEDWVYLYRYVPPPVENIPISVETFPVEDLVPTEDNIKYAVKLLHNHRSRGSSGMRD